MVPYNNVITTENLQWKPHLWNDSPIRFTQWPITNQFMVLQNYWRTSGSITCPMSTCSQWQMLRWLACQGNCWAWKWMRLHSETHTHWHVIFRILLDVTLQRLREKFISGVLCFLRMCVCDIPDCLLNGVVKCQLSNIEAEITPSPLPPPPPPPPPLMPDHWMGH